jgi:ArsR family transcriptional regulator, arsenate/arsenite/antimonite-responsive transcriptional repressor
VVKRSTPSPNVFRALADPTRREILQLLRNGALNSGEIADRFEATWPTISRHLAVLREAGLVLSVRHKQEVRYELNTSVLQDLVQHVMQLVAPSAAARPAPRKARRLGERPQEA